MEKTRLSRIIIVVFILVVIIDICRTCYQNHYDKTNCIEFQKIRLIHNPDDDGITIMCKVKNTSDKTIKYVHFRCNLLNQFGDPIRCDKTNKTEFRGTIMGPIEPGTSEENYWPNTFYSEWCKMFKVTGVSIEYVDGSSIKLTGDFDRFTIPGAIRK